MIEHFINFGSLLKALFAFLFDHSPSKNKDFTPRYKMSAMRCFLFADLSPSSVCPCYRNNMAIISIPQTPDGLHPGTNKTPMEFTPL